MQLHTLQLTLTHAYCQVPAIVASVWYFYDFVDVHRKKNVEKSYKKITPTLTHCQNQVNVKVMSFGSSQYFFLILPKQVIHLPLTCLYFAYLRYP